MYKTHKAVYVYSPFEKEYVSIDEKIVDLIKAIWAKGIDTINSCQKNEGLIWIEFATVFDAERFINILRKPLYDMPFDYADWFFSRIEGGEGDYLKPWKHTANIWDFGEVIDDTYYNKQPEFFSISTRFPVEDYKRVLFIISEGSSGRL